MVHIALWRWLKQGSGNVRPRGALDRAPAQGRRRRPVAYPLCIERLEERCLLSYQITDLGTLPGYTDGSEAYGINDSGQVVGDSYGRSSGHAFLWDAATGMQDLGTLPGDTYSQARGINDSAQVVGISYTTIGRSQSSHAFLWDATTGMQDLGTLPGDTDSQAYGINDSGQVVGISYSRSSVHAFLWDAATGMQDLGTLPGYSGSEAYGINNNGQVVGRSGPHAFLWDASNGMQDLGTLPGYSYSSASGINNNGQVVGYSSFYSGHAFLWDASNGMQDLGTLPGLTDSVATAINDSGQVVGDSLDADERYAFLWQNGTMTALNDLLPPGSGWTLPHATAINNGGQIVGWGIHNGQFRAYLLTPDFLAVTTPASAVAGMPFDVTVTALDSFGNVDTRYTGTVHFTSSDPQAQLPDDYTFTATDAGVHSFPSGAKRTLQHWQQDADLGGVRGAALDKLPEAERQPWQQLWADVEQILMKLSHQGPNDTKEKGSN